jgi:hypothetical protein
MKILTRVRRDLDTSMSVCIALGIVQRSRRVQARGRRIIVAGEDVGGVEDMAGVVIYLGEPVGIVGLALEDGWKFDAPLVENEILLGTSDRGQGVDAGVRNVMPVLDVEEGEAGLGASFDHGWVLGENAHAVIDVGGGGVLTFNPRAIDHVPVHGGENVECEASILRETATQFGFRHRLVRKARKETCCVRSAIIDEMSLRMRVLNNFGDLEVVGDTSFNLLLNTLDVVEVPSFNLDKMAVGRKA